MDVGHDAARVVERPRTNEANVGPGVLAVEGDPAGRAAEDPLDAPVVAGDVNRLRIPGEEFDPVGLDQEVHHERAPRLPLAI
jgi:hypothetical protein